MSLTIGGLLEELNKNRFLLAAMLLGAVVALLSAYYVLPLAEGIIFGVFFFFVTRPIKIFLDRYTKYSPYIATFCLLMPLIAVLAYGVIGVLGEAQWVFEHSGELRDMVVSAIEGLGLPIDVSAGLDVALKSLYDYSIEFLKTIPVGRAFSGAVSLAMNALVSLFVCFYLLKDGGTFATGLREVVPARHKPAMDMFMAEADRILAGIYTGTFYTALYIAAGALVLFIVFGIPYKALLTAFVFIAAMVPILSGMMVFIPISIYLYIFRSPLIGVLFLGLAVIFIYLPPDYIIRPYIINKASNLHPLLIILAFIGGGVAGGLSGFFAAPMAIGLATALYRTYKKTKGNDEDIH
jgi:predicted PurR-regulated permease PerM